MKHKEHNHFMRFNEALNMVSLQVDQIRETHMHHEKYHNPAGNILLYEPYSAQHLLAIIGLALAKDLYLDRINQVDHFEQKYRPALLESHREAIQQIDSFLEMAKGKVINIGRLRIALSFGSDDACTSAPVS